MTRDSTRIPSEPANEEQPGPDDWLIDRIARHTLQTILDENRRVHALEDRITRLERQLDELGVDPAAI